MKLSNHETDKPRTTIFFDPNFLCDELIPLGSILSVVNSATGSVASSLRYDEFGRITSSSTPEFQPFGFAGGVNDLPSKLVRFGARDYDPETGRWTAKDPILFAGGDTNLYGYILADPVNAIDPLGLCKLSQEQRRYVISSAAVGAILGARWGPWGALGGAVLAGGGSYGAICGGDNFNFNDILNLPPPPGGPRGVGGLGGSSGGDGGGSGDTGGEGGMCK